LKIGDPKAFKITNLISEIHSGKIRLPEFQRDFRWDTNNVAELYSTIISGYPAGTLLLWEVEDGKAKLDTREFEQSLGTLEIKYLVLDGQQRLTSLYQSLMHPYAELKGGRKRRFFVRIDKLGNPDDAIESYSPNEVSKYDLDNIDTQVKKLLLPLSVVATDGLKDWIDRFARTKWLQSSVDLSNIDLYDKIRNDFMNTYTKENKPLYNLQEYEFNAIVLPSTLGLDAVATIFEKLNTSGVELNIFEILTAKFFKNVNLREKWDETKTRNPIIAKFGKDDKDTSIAILILKTILLLKNPSTGPAFEIKGECKRSSLLNDLSSADVMTHWDRVATIFGQVLVKLENDYGVLARKYMPYDTMLVTLAVVFDYVERLVPATSKSKAFAKIRSWYWTSVFANRYDSSTDTKSKDDAEDIVEWISDSTKVPSYVSSFKPEEVNLREATRGAVYTGVLNHLFMNGIQDFVTGENIRTLVQSSPSVVDEHHIFPQKYLKRHYGDKSDEFTRLRNSVVNMTVIKDETNRNYIKDEAPSTYLASVDIAKQLPNIEDNHLIPTDVVRTVEDPATRKQFIDFVNAREASLRNLIGKSVVV